ncbi:hypothetical protein C8R45DRAFT_1070292 [Mycena sanguinolenta]|nr:hypothetical protein C8R45DRAFT_1070292 [Mycena sanguinolenta]
MASAGGGDKSRGQTSGCLTRKRKRRVPTPAEAAGSDNGGQPAAGTADAHADEEQGGQFFFPLPAAPTYRAAALLLRMAWTVIDEMLRSASKHPCMRTNRQSKYERRGRMHCRESRKISFTFPEDETQKMHDTASAQSDPHIAMLAVAIEQGGTSWRKENACDVTDLGRRRRAPPHKSTQTKIVLVGRRVSNSAEPKDSSTDRSKAQVARERPRQPGWTFAQANNSSSQLFPGLRSSIDSIFIIRDRDLRQIPSYSSYLPAACFNHDDSIQRHALTSSSELGLTRPSNEPRECCDVYPARTIICTRRVTRVLRQEQDILSHGLYARAASPLLSKPVVPAADVRDCVPTVPSCIIRIQMIKYMESTTSKVRTEYRMN